MAGRPKKDPQRFADLFRVFGPVAVRRMFSGEGLFVDGLMMGLVAGERIYLKADAAGRAAFEAEGCPQFMIRRGEKRIGLPYFEMPDRLYDDAEEFAVWARRALAAAKAKPAKKRVTSR